MKNFFIRLGTSISQKLPCLIKSFVYANGELTLNVDSSSLSKVLFFLKYHTNFRKNYLIYGFYNKYVIINIKFLS